jgi:uncharacterized protein YdbL (DUF1318 family)
MLLKKYVKSILLLLLVIFVLCTPGLTDDIKARMKARLPVVVELKSKGIVGENSNGLLEFVGNKKEQAAVIEAENKDRLIVYEAIAKQTGTTPEVVAKRRAIQIAEKANPGEWLKDENGKWYQKK